MRQQYQFPKINAKPEALIPILIHLRQNKYLQLQRLK